MYTFNILSPIKTRPLLAAAPLDLIEVTNIPFPKPSTSSSVPPRIVKPKPKKISYNHQTFISPS